MSSGERTSEVSEMSMAAYLADANPNVLRAVMYYLTGDPELAAMSSIQVERRGGAFLEQLLSGADADRVRAIALDYLRDHGTGADVPFTGDPTRARIAVALLHGREVSDSEFRLAERELQLKDLSGLEWSSQGRQRVKDWKVLVVGAGFSGIAMAVKLQQLGVPYSLVEKQRRIGGTWERNQFPEARVDTTSFVYQYSFVDRYPWPEHYAPQSEVRKYLEYVADEYGVTPNVRLETAVVEARFDITDGAWDVELENSAGDRWHERADAIVSASGLFSTPRVPDFEGLDTFEGTLVHSAAWDSTFDPAGKRVVIIGNGSTGVQILPWLAKNADDVTLVQRTPQWISPMERYKEQVSDGLRWLHDNIPLYWRWSCFNARLIRATLGDAQEYDYVWQATGGAVSRRNDGLRRNLEEYIHSKLSSRPDLLAAVTPDYAPLARRLVVDNGWYDAIVQPNVTLVTGGVDHVEPNAIVCSDGTRVECDAIVLATGFEAQKYSLPATYVGTDGRTLEDHWVKDGPRAYVGLEIPAFPNFFIMYGPNAQPRGGSLVAAVELWVDYISRLFARIAETGNRFAVVKEAHFEAYNAAMDEATRSLIWETAAPRDKNYYVNEFGRQNVNMPWRLPDYAHILGVDLEVTHEFG